MGSRVTVAVPLLTAQRRSQGVGVCLLVCMLAHSARRSACFGTLLIRSVRSAQTAASTSRRDEYAAISDRDITFFLDVLGDNGVVTDPHALQPLNR